MEAAKSPWPLDQIQGFLLRGYRQSFVRYFALSVKDAAEARAFIASLVDGSEAGPQITTAQPWAIKPATSLNIGFTFRGLKNLGVPQASLDSFSDPNNVDINSFAAGAATRAIAAPNGVGDVGASAPSNWIVSDQTFDVLLMLFARNMEEMENASSELRAAFAGGFDGSPAMEFDGQALEDGQIYFGYRDGIAQPTIKGSPFAREPDGDQVPVDPGAFLMGEAEPGGFYSTMVLPTPDVLAHYGCFASFRILRQDVDGFEAQADQLAPTVGGQFGITDPEVQKAAVRALICGRWPNGTPLMVAPIDGDAMPAPLPPQQVNDFQYGSDIGQKCPIGAHIRRGNARDTNPKLVNGQPIVNHRILRRAMPYQIPYDPKDRHSGERGLIGLFLGASFLKQFEFAMENWINYPNGFATDPGGADPMMGTNSKPAGQAYFETIQTPKTKAFKMPMQNFVFTKGSAYCLFPGIDGIRWIAQNGG
jgi:deferrochelatase/peroxidase EfeB